MKGRWYGYIVSTYVDYLDVTGAVGLCGSLFLAKTFLLVVTSCKIQVIFPCEFMKKCGRKLSIFRCSSHSNVSKEHLMSLSMSVHCVYQSRNYTSSRASPMGKANSGVWTMKVPPHWGLWPQGLPQWGSFRSMHLLPLACLTLVLCPCWVGNLWAFTISS